MGLSRRDFLGAAAFASLTFRDTTLDTLQKLTTSSDPVAAAADEDYWAKIREAFEFSPELVMFNHAGLCPSPRMVREMEVTLAKEANTGPSYVVWRTQRGQLFAARQRIAKFMGASVDETAMMLNATHGLQTVIMGFKLKPGDEILTTSEDYPRTLTAIRQRVRRDGIRLNQVQIPPFAGAAEIKKAILAGLTPQTKLVVLCHITYISGLIFPVVELQKELSARGIALFVDGAHSLGHEDDRISTLGCPLYCSCFHKWVNGPLGTGVLVVKQDLIREIWPLQPAEESLDPLIQKFENVGSEPHARILSLLPTLDFHDSIGEARKKARLEFLRRKWVRQVAEIPGVTIVGGADPVTTRLVGLIQVKGLSHLEVIGALWRRARIHTTSMAMVSATRISANVFTSPAEIELLVSTLRAIAKEGR